ncbi:MAG TPA: IMP cyclohydrolase [Smithella sp.]|nr:IMP cyclohydrolase [Smithella sp.]MDM7988667.1 IMP cyclohydrolase [Smithella sp.]HNY49388.1 IMP cyclohydrolase [Smithella sp.]HOG89421.1 IMP cyclohydrolase [Smithella sp.]HOU51504.1 IMP cyclohydrolase [Smithella sp.]
MKKNVYKYLAGNEYPGRGICIGKTPSGQTAMIAYFIMGRSTNSRNRVFDPIDGGIRTKAADPSKMTDPHLIIYNPVLTLGKTTIVTNGDQTNTIYDFISRNEFPGYGFEAALATRTFEDDKPNWTPRISGVLDMRLGGYKLSILKSNEGNEQSVQRFTFDYPQPVAGEGHFISTYKCNGNPIPSFVGDPIRVAIDEEDPDKYAAKLWKALNEENKVSLFVRAIDLRTQTYKDVIINKYKALEG